MSIAEDLSSKTMLIEIRSLNSKSLDLNLRIPNELRSRELEIRIRDQLGVKQQLVNKKEIHDLEPNIKPFYHGGVFYDYARHARNPRKILIKLFENFVNKGGKFLKLNIQDIDFDEEKPVLRTETQRFIFDKLVVACGAFSKRLTDKLHENIPLDTERGYHVHFKDYDHLISRPIVYANRGFGMTPMEPVSYTHLTLPTKRIV